jgi:predicted aconitase with swiveling domain
MGNGGEGGVIFKGRRVVKGKVSGEALVCKEPISFLGGIDPATGNVVEKGHALEGHNVTGKILIYPTGKGSTGGSYRLYDMAFRGTAPAALVNREAEPITVIGAVLGNVPMVDRVTTQIFGAIKMGDVVEVDANAGTVCVGARTKTREPKGRRRARR